MTRYKQWADDLFFETVAQVPRDALVAPRPILFGSLLRTLNHSCAMDYVWQCHLLGVPHGLTTRNPEFCPEFDALRMRQAELDAWYVEYASGMQSPDLDHIVEFTFIGGNTGRMSRRDILLHVVNHCTYHRGHAADMLYTLGIFPPTTDLPVFVSQPQATSPP
ncbi:DinB family protein [Lysobacter sp. HA18]